MAKQIFENYDDEDNLCFMKIDYTLCAVFKEGAIHIDDEYIYIETKNYNDKLKYEEFTQLQDYI